MLNHKTSFTLLGLVLAIGIICGAFILGGSLSEIRKEERYVTVKGFSEKEVKADLAVWPIRIRVAGNDLSQVSGAIEGSRTKVIQFLTEKGFKSEEISQQDLRVSDRQASDYSQSSLKEFMRYVIENTILVRTNDIDNVKKVSQMTDSLIKAGVVFSSGGEWRGSGPRYLYTKLNEIKPGMMAEATRNARAAANQFAADSGSKVGSIKKASQGLFSINDRDESPAGTSEGGGGSSSSDPFKRVRVVVTVEYLLLQ